MNDSRRPKAIDMNKYRALIMDVYLHCLKGKIKLIDLRKIASTHKLDSYYLPRTMIRTGMLEVVDIDNNPRLLGWAMGMPTDEMIVELAEKTSILRHQEQKQFRINRQERRRAMKQPKQTPDEPVETPEQPDATAITSDIYCVKFGDEKMYFSQWSFNRIKAIARLLSVENE